MLVHFSIVGVVNHHGDFKIELDSVPREGDIVNIPELSQGDTVVRTVVWYPLGVDPSEALEIDSTPFVYVVVGPPRPA